MQQILSIHLIDSAVLCPMKAEFICLKIMFGKFLFKILLIFFLIFNIRLNHIISMNCANMAPTKSISKLKDRYTSCIYSAIFIPVLDCNVANLTPPMRGHRGKPRFSHVL